MPLTPSAHLDTFARNHLPPREQWPDMVFREPFLQFPERLNVAQELLDAQVSRGFGRRTLFVTDHEPWTYEMTLERVDRIARVLTADLGLEPGNRVLLRSPNNPMAAACWLAVLKAGGIAVSTMPLLRAREIGVIGSKARVQLALCDVRLLGELDAARAGIATLRRVLTFDGSRATPEGELASHMARQPRHFDAVATAADDVAIVAFTSGTTGAPKGAMHFHRDVLAGAECFPRTDLPTEPDDVFGGSPPLAFTFGLGGLLLFPMRAAASVALVERPTPEALLDVVQRHRVTKLFSAPTAFRTMLARLGACDLSSLNACVSAGETLPLPTWEAWRDRTGLRLIDGIGSTELFHIFISSSGDGIRPGATGRPVLGYEARIVDEDFRDVPPGTVGRLAVRGPTGCKYLADDRQTQYVVRGWNLTGDAYRRDEDGYYWFEARTDDMIISAGYNISGPEVEESLMRHPAVAEAAVVASPDAERGNIVKAFVILAPGHDANPDLARTLQEFVKADIAPYKYPRSVEFVPELPRTETGKIQRFKLRQQEVERSRSAGSPGGPTL